MFKGLPLAIAFIALPAVAAPQLTTEIKPGDVWVSTGFSQNDMDIDYKNPDSGATASQSQSSDEFGISSLIAFNKANEFTPVMGITFVNEDAGLENAKIFSGKIGAIKETVSKKKIGLFLGYNYSDNPDETRGSYEASLAFQTSQVLSKKYNEVEVALNIPKSEGETKGGRELSIFNNLKLSPNDVMDIELIAGLSVLSDIESIDSDLKAESDLIFKFGGRVYFNLDSQLSLSAGIGKTFGGTTFKDSTGKLNADFDGTQVIFSLSGRF